MGLLNCFTASHSWQFIIQIQKGSVYTMFVVLYNKNSVQMYVYSINTEFGFAMSLFVCVFTWPVMSLNLYCGFWSWSYCDIKQCDSQIKTRQKIY